MPKIYLTATFVQARFCLNSKIWPDFMKILLFIMWIEQNVHFFEKNYFILNNKLKSSMNGEWFSYKLVVRILESSNIREVPWMESAFICKIQGTDENVRIMEKFGEWRVPWIESSLYLRNFWNAIQPKGKSYENFMLAKVYFLDIQMKKSFSKFKYWFFAFNVRDFFVNFWQKTFSVWIVSKSCLIFNFACHSQICEHVCNSVI